jgi:hypothetical protein
MNESRADAWIKNYDLTEVKPQCFFRVSFLKEMYTKTTRYLEAQINGISNWHIKKYSMLKYKAKTMHTTMSIRFKIHS